MAMCRSTWTASGSTRLVDQALDGIPDELARLVRNVVVLVEDEPPEGEPDDLLGLYDGVALTERDSTVAVQLPDRIFIFRGPLLDFVRVRGGAGRGGADHRRARDRAPLRHRRRPAARARLRLEPTSPATTSRPRTRRARRRSSATAYAVPRSGPRPVGLHRERGVRREAAAEADAEQGEPVAGRAGPTSRPSRRADHVGQPDARREPLRVQRRGQREAQRRTDRRAQRDQQRGHSSPPSAATRRRRPVGTAARPRRPRPGRRRACRAGRQRGRGRPSASRARVCSAYADRVV